MKVRAFMSVAIGIGVSVAPAAVADAKPPTEPVTVAAEELGIDGSLATDPWRAEQLADGSLRLVWGPGSEAQPVDPSATKVASGVAAAPASADEDTSDAAPAVALAWYCNMYTTYSTDLTGGNNLRTYYEVDCYGVNRHRVDWQFQRSSWSGYRSYTNWQTGGWVSSTTNATYINAYCSGGGGTYDYRGNIKSVVDVGDIRTSPSQATQKGRYTCGTGVS